MMQRLDLTVNERAVLITALRRLVDFDPRSLSPQTHALKAILERLEPHKPQPITRYCGHRLSLPTRVFVRGVRLVDVQHHWPAGSGRRCRLLRPDAGMSHVAGHWRKFIPSAELMADPECGARCGIRDTRAPRATPLPLDRYRVRRA
jgi:hypothetical protein